MKILLLLSIVLPTILLAQLNIVVSILPQQTFVKKICGDLGDVEVMVSRGASPHSYEPKPSQMIALSKADIYFTMGVEFEKAWLQKFHSQNKELHFSDMNKDIVKIAMQSHHHHDEEESHHHEGLNPHTWTSPKNVAVMAQNIYRELVKLDPKNGTLYKQNLVNFLLEIEQTDQKIKKILENKEGVKFMVFHPAWGYFARDYKLEEVAIEVEGKAPKPKQLMEIIDEAKEEQVNVIITQPEFSDKSAQVIAKETGLKVKKFSPLAPQWSENLINLAETIAK